VGHTGVGLPVVGAGPHCDLKRNSHNLRVRRAGFTGLSAGGRFFTGHQNLQLGVDAGLIRLIGIRLGHPKTEQEQTRQNKTDFCSQWRHESKHGFHLFEVRHHLAPTGLANWFFEESARGVPASGLIPGWLGALFIALVATRCDRLAGV